MLAPNQFTPRESSVPSSMSVLLKLLIAPLIGVLLGLLAMFGLVYSQTQAPETNPASQPILSYGD